MTTTLARLRLIDQRPYTVHLHAEPEEVYAAGRKQHLSSHALNEFRRNPLLFRKRELNLVPEERRAAYEVGRAIHTRVLEGANTFATRYAVGGPINPKTNRTYGEDTKAFAEWAALQGRPVVSTDTAALCDAVSNAVHGHAQARDLLADGIAEGVARCDYGGVSSQVRIDWMHPGRGIIDLKSTDNLDWFEIEVRNFGYVHQQAFYRGVIGAIANRDVPVHLIAVEKREPYRVGVWQISSNSLQAAERDNLAAIERLQACRATDRWPTGYEDIRVYDHIA
ncbi:MAG: PD-(D/E)XK nuclease-like domain-containing protein [Planctomycetes bacterium]|nr:PD-(D/E)XK nuclease-like domain-containing protein [Nannocystis sp.]MBA3546306.1 PD-(D/E)XK nuclease-like domain-containing protein [Nannocystis sp.]MBA3845087.1 PD-(D/E)XK nuclease-like domain-containing protein [Planctomycetota bacterium]